MISVYSTRSGQPSAAVVSSLTAFSTARAGASSRPPPGLVHQPFALPPKDAVAIEEERELLIGFPGGFSDLEAKPPETAAFGSRKCIGVGGADDPPAAHPAAEQVAFAHHGLAVADAVAAGKGQNAVLRVAVDRGTARPGPKTFSRRAVIMRRFPPSARDGSGWRSCHAPSPPSR